MRARRVFVHHIRRRRRARVRLAQGAPQQAGVARRSAGAARGGRGRGQRRAQAGGGCAGAAGAWVGGCGARAYAAVAADAGPPAPGPTRMTRTIYIQAFTGVAKSQAGAPHATCCIAITPLPGAAHCCALSAASFRPCAGMACACLTPDPPRRRWPPSLVLAVAAPPTLAPTQPPKRHPNFKCASRGWPQR
ncbi:MAG: hypothetical protein J3K34DRAFT_412174 [Monoraphidium minutum]|nr:MAG: hypothetical protein J3K34DRAFT_412174 [Monoraphidium minutum]